MSRSARIGAVLAILAALLLANPMYAGLFTENRERQPTGYAAVPVDPSTSDDQRAIVQQLGTDEILHVASMEDGYGSPYGRTYRAPRRAGSLLRQARTAGNASTTAHATSRTLHRIAANYEFVVFEKNDEPSYYRIRIATQSNGTVVSLTPADLSAVAAYVVDSDAILLSSLPSYQRETFRKLKDAGEYGYRPYSDEVHDMTDNLVVQDDTYYLLEERIHVDDFNILPALVRLGFTGLGIVLLLGAVLSTAKSFRSAPD